LYSSSTTNVPWLSPTENWLVPEPNEFCHLYSRGTDMHHRKHMSRDQHLPLRDVNADTEDTASSTIACWTVFTELLPGNALIKSVTIYVYIHRHTQFCIELLVNTCFFTTGCMFRHRMSSSDCYARIFIQMKPLSQFIL
jgi:hypothetical protein